MMDLALAAAVGISAAVAIHYRDRAKAAEAVLAEHRLRKSRAVAQGNRTRAARQADLVRARMAEIQRDLDLPSANDGETR